MRVLENPCRKGIFLEIETIHGRTWRFEGLELITSLMIEHEVLFSLNILIFIATDNEKGLGKSFNNIAWCPTLVLLLPQGVCIDALWRQSTFSKSDRSRDKKHRGDKSLDLLSFSMKNRIFQHSIFNIIPQVQIYKFLRSPPTITPISRSFFLIIC